MGKFQSTKIFDNYSVAIRQWKAQHSHYQLLHGYALKFKVFMISTILLSPMFTSMEDDKFSDLDIELFRKFLGIK